ncbi:MAG: hypothetical protein HYR85_23880 [Planctomycetes bacterium]|nr:hypothetical protein [Planctomycetota bacterium]MBI3847215.1 hypothetical protein [Planctomycetota bacterium]
MQPFTRFVAHGCLLAVAAGTLTVPALARQLPTRPVRNVASSTSGLSPADVERKLREGGRLPISKSAPDAEAPAPPLGVVAPPNDDCAAAQPAIIGTVAFDNQAATAQASDPPFPCGGGGAPFNSLWYSFAPGVGGDYTIDTCGSTFDTLLAVWTGAACGPYVNVGCNDDACGLQSQLTVSLLAGTTYRIEVDGFGTATGTGSLTVARVGGGPVNDNCAAAIVVPPNGPFPIRRAEDTTLATTEATDPLQSCSFLGPDQNSHSVWFRWTPTTTADALVETCGSDYDTVLTVYTGVCGAFQEIACNDDGGSPNCAVALQSGVSWRAIAGREYFAEVTRFGLGPAGNLVIALDRGVALPDNDDCGGATPLAGGGPFPIAGNQSTAGATVAVDDPVHTCTGRADVASVWFSWTPAAAFNATFHTCTSNFDTVVAVYTGACGNLTEVVCNDDSAVAPCPATLQSVVTWPATANTRYLIQVCAANAGPGGQLNYSLDCVALPQCNVNLNLPDFVFQTADVQATAAGVPAGGAYQWERIQNGAGRVNLVAANNQATVTGTQASGALNDVTIRVTYTAPNGAVCRADRNLTVVRLELTHIKFDHKGPNRNLTDALNIRKSATEDLAHTGNGVGSGEWVSAGQAEAARNEPALYVANQAVTVRVRFKIQPAAITSARIGARAQGTLFAGVIPQVVRFAGGRSNPGYVEMTMDQRTPNRIDKLQGQLQWYCNQLNGGPVDEVSRLTGPHTFYVVLGVPQSPWYGSERQHPWVSALEFTIARAGTLQNNTIPIAASTITTFVHSGFGLKYDIATGACRYCWSGYGQVDFAFSSFINRTSQIVNCVDCAAAISTMMNLVGGTSQYLFLQPFGYIQRGNLIGRGDCNNPFIVGGASRVIRQLCLGVNCVTDIVAPFRTRFGNHAFTIMNGGIYDACVGPHLGTETPLQYLQGAIDFSTYWEWIVSGGVLNIYPYNTVRVY